MPNSTLLSILLFGISANLAFTRENNMTLPVRVPLTISPRCLSQERINTVGRNLGAVVEEMFLTKPCSCGGAGWTRVAYLNMSDPQQTCPSNWTLNTSPVRGCGRTSTGRQTCDSVVYAVNSLAYSRVCGRITAYHEGWMDGFRTVSSVESYVSGVSITHGPPGIRRHVWTFIGAENDVEVSDDNCPCANSSITWPYPTPSFLGNDYFCDTGRHVSGYRLGIYLNDPLWDGDGCSSTSSCCEFNSPPWFCKSLPQPTTDDLEIRLCNYFSGSSANKIVTLMDIYVK